MLAYVCAWSSVGVYDALIINHGLKLLLQRVKLTFINSALATACAPAGMHTAGADVCRKHASGSMFIWTW